MNSLVEMEHSPLGGSEAHRWTACPGSVRAQVGLADKPSRYAQEGTDGHAEAAAILRLGWDAWDDSEFRVIVTDAAQPIPENDLEDAIDLYCSTVFTDQRKRGGELIIERKFQLTDLHVLFQGTPDCLRLGDDGVLCVYDLKLGKGHVVEVADGNKPNLQLAYYAMGALNEIFTRQRASIKQIELVIVQPRAEHPDGPVRRFRAPVPLLDELTDFFKERAAKTADPYAPRIPGQHCTFCRAAGTCPALRAYSYDVANFSGNGCGEPHSLSPEGLAHVLDAAGVIETWIRALRDEAHRIAATGEEIPGWKMVDRIGHRKWIDEKKAADQLGHRFTNSQIYSYKLKSPAQIEALDKKLKEKWQPLWTKPVTGQDLVRETRVRPARIGFKDDAGMLDYDW